MRMHKCPICKTEYQSASDAALCSKYGEIHRLINETLQAHQFLSFNTNGDFRIIPAIGIKTGSASSCIANEAVLNLADSDNALRLSEILEGEIRSITVEKAIRNGWFPDNLEVWREKIYSNHDYTVKNEYAVAMMNRIAKISKKDAETLLTQRGEYPQKLRRTEIRTKLVNLFIFPHSKF